MRKNYKKLSAALVTAALMLTVSIPAFADAAPPMDGGEIGGVPVIVWCILATVVVVITAAVVIAVINKRKRSGRNGR